jgi:hypothetical protein
LAFLLLGGFEADPADDDFSLELTAVAIVSAKAAAPIAKPCVKRFRRVLCIVTPFGIHNRSSGRPQSLAEIPTQKLPFVNIGNIGSNATVNNLEFQFGSIAAHN